jgi:hypothetical protein
MQAFALETLEGLSGRLVELGLLHGLWIGLFAASVLAIAFRMRPQLMHAARYAMLVVGLFLAAIGPMFATPLHYALSSRPTKTIESRPVGYNVECPLGFESHNLRERPCHNRQRAQAVLCFRT